MSKREQAVADCAASDARHRAAWTREQHRDAHRAVERRAMLRQELEALGIDHYDRAALARIARVGALLVHLGLESEPIDQVIEEGPLAKGLQEEISDAQSELDELRNAARAYLDAQPGLEHKAAKQALEKLL